MSQSILTAIGIVGWSVIAVGAILWAALLREPE